MENTFTWISPGEIDGPPVHVRAVTRRQLVELSKIVASLGIESSRMLMSSGLSRYMEEHGAEGAVDGWQLTEEAQAVSAFKGGTIGFVAGVNKVDNACKSGSSQSPAPTKT
jgi:hypothetical protein